MRLAELALLLPTGACLGSLATTTGIRISRNEDFVRGRSHCDGCGRILGFIDTIPLYSYLRVAGSCPACGERIDVAHPVGEITGAAIVVCAFVFAPPFHAALVAALGLVLLASAVVDARIHRLPDFLTFAVAVAALGLAALRSERWLATCALSAVATVVALLSATWLYRLRRGRVGLGLGDIKLLGALALWLGPATPWALFAASLGALVLSLPRLGANQRIAFGPAIGMAGFAFGLAQEAGLSLWR